jgi:hypothetical protein
VGGARGAQSPAAASRQQTASKCNHGQRRRKRRVNLRVPNPGPGLGGHLPEGQECRAGKLADGGRRLASSRTCIGSSGVRRSRAWEAQASETGQSIAGHLSSEINSRGAGGMGGGRWAMLDGRWRSGDGKVKVEGETMHRHAQVPGTARCSRHAGSTDT